MNNQIQISKEQLYKKNNTIFLNISGRKIHATGPDFEEINIDPLDIPFLRLQPKLNFGKFGESEVTEDGVRITKRGLSVDGYEATKKAKENLEHVKEILAKKDENLKVIFLGHPSQAAALPGQVYCFSKKNSDSEFFINDIWTFEESYDE